MIGALKLNIHTALWRRFCVAFLISFVFSELAWAENDQWVKEQDGIKAELRIVDRQAIVRWRFLKSIPAPIGDVTGKLDGTPLGAPVLQAFPAAGESATLLTLIDNTSKNRSVEIAHEIAMLLSITTDRPSFLNIFFASYTDGVQPIVASSIEDLVTKLTSIETLDVEPDMANALEGGIIALSSLPGQRRGIFVFTDGHSQPPIDAEKIVKTASANGTAITFILSNGQRSVERSKLDGIAAQTGGEVIDESRYVEFLRAPFLLLTSGGTETFQLPDIQRFFWQENPEVSIAIHYGEKSLELRSTVPIPTAGVWETSRFAKNYLKGHPILAAGFGSVLLALAGLTFVMIRPRKRTLRVEVAEPQHRPVFAVLENIANGEAYPIQTTLVKMGRGNENDVVLSDGAVSRLHAVMQQEPLGKFAIENRSESNGTFVNHQQIQRTMLSEGDLISMGSTTLRFSQVFRPKMQHAG
jgi:hypothetical protein